MNVAVFLEDAIAVGGVGVAAVGIGLTALTGNVRHPTYLVHPPKKHTHTHRLYIINSFDDYDLMIPFASLGLFVIYTCVPACVRAGWVGALSVRWQVAFDALGSIGVGLLMGGVSTFVIAKNRRLLGQSVPESTNAVVELLLKDEVRFMCVK